MGQSPMLKYQFGVKFGCIFGCFNYASPHDNNSLWCNNCGTFAKASISLVNLADEVEAEFEIGIEKLNKSITSISKEAKKMPINDSFNCSYVFTGKDRGCISADGIITFVISIKNTKSAENINLPKEPKQPGVLVKLAEKISEMCENTDAPPDAFVDVTLHVEGKKIYGYKAILCLTSKYFDRMFASNMKEANTNDVYLENIEFTTMKALVQFMYTDSIDEDKITLELLAAADRFEVMRLMEICCQELSKTITLENVGQIWETCYVRNIEELTQDCTIYIAKNWKSLSKDEKFLELAEKNCDLPITIASLLSEKNEYCN